MICLRGYGAVFLQDETHCGRVEYFDAAAFNAAIRQSDNAFLNFGYHDAAPLSGAALKMFVDDYGVGFQASIADFEWKAIKPCVLTNYSFCSVQTTNEKSERVLHNGTWMTRIYSVQRIDHICVTCAPAYSGTGIWPSPTHVVGAMPARLAALNARWEIGNANHRRALAASQRRQKQDERSTSTRLAAAMQPTFRPNQLILFKGADDKISKVTVARARELVRRREASR